MRLIPSAPLFAALGAGLLAGCALDGEAEAPPMQRNAEGEVVLDSVETEAATFRVRRMMSGRDHPWAVAWLPDGRKLITERSGDLLLADGDSATALSGVPEVLAEGQGGLLDVRLHPDYEKTGWIYLTYSAPGEGDAGTVLARAKLEGDTALTDLETLYRQFPFVESNIHFGSRIAFPGDGTVVVTLGERGQRGEGPGAQDSTNTIGTTVRLTLDGDIPEDNPFVGREDIPDELYSYGHRNQQGMAIHPETRAIWQQPAVTYGDEYSDQSPIGGVEAPGMTQPVTYWDPSPALSGMAFYTGDRFPDWQGDLFLGALSHQKMLRVELDGAAVAHQEEFLSEEFGRIRDVATGPDGYLYFLTDAEDGKLYRLEPIEEDAAGAASETGGN
ncbi:MAG: pyrroloquinoline-quinone glucose dehydrogenase [Bacteroidetes bacterium SW_4_67_19]|nr:MAG: pyrroloquinoline-quinone glucose dehydrogenase [Bacteroidetes bacterium SW_4_67_19]